MNSVLALRLFNPDHVPTYPGYCYVIFSTSSSVESKSKRPAHDVYCLCVLQVHVLPSLSPSTLLLAYGVIWLAIYCLYRLVWNCLRKQLSYIDTLKNA